MLFQSTIQLRPGANTLNYVTPAKSGLFFSAFCEQFLARSRYSGIGIWPRRIPLPPGGIVSREFHGFLQRNFP